MSENKSISGSVSVARHATIGGKAVVRGSLSVNHNLNVDGWLDARNIKAANKGLFKSADALEAAYPSPQNGWFALVGDTLPADIYRVESGKWTATGEQGGELTADVTQYQEAVEQLSDQLAADEDKIQANADGIDALEQSMTAYDGKLTDLDTAIKTAETSTKELDEKVKGTGENADASVYPKVDLGTFLTWEAFNDKLDELLKSAESKYNGFLRATVNGTSVLVLQQAIYESAAYWSQSVFGVCKPKEDGSGLELATEVYFTKRDNVDGMKEWKIYSGGLGNHFYGVYDTAGDLPEADLNGFAYVVADSEKGKYKMYAANDGVWTDSGTTITLGGDYSGLKERVVADEAKIAANAKSITELDGWISDTREALQAMNDDFSNDFANIEKAYKAADAALSEKVTANAESIKTLQNTASGSASDIKGLSTSLSSEVTRAKAAETKIQNAALKSVLLGKTVSQVTLTFGKGDNSTVTVTLPVVEIGASAGVMTSSQLSNIMQLISQVNAAVQTEETRAKAAETSAQTAINTRASSLQAGIDALKSAVDAIPSNFIITGTATDLADPGTFTLGTFSNSDLIAAAKSGGNVSLIVTGPDDSSGYPTYRTFFATNCTILDSSDMRDGSAVLDFTFIANKAVKHFIMETSTSDAFITVIS